MRRQLPRLRRVLPAAALLPLLVAAGCKEGDKPPTAVRVGAQAVTPEQYAPSFTLTGEVAARVQSDLSFRITGRIVERLVDVGSVVKADDLLARLEPTEQRADVAAATAAVTAAEAKVKQTTATFERQKTLIDQGFTTRRDYDNAVQELQGAKSGLDNARAQLSTARDQLAHAELRAPAAGLITARFMEAGQVAQSSMRVFTLAQEGPRDVSINVQESLVPALARARLDIALASDPRITATGTVREVTPALDTQTGTVRIKVGLEAPPKEMVLGSSVTVTARTTAQTAFMVPWTAITSREGKSAVWLIEPTSKTVSLRDVDVQSFESDRVVVKAGLRADDLVVTRGGQLLRPGQRVEAVMERTP
jgi:RND family efflux transporter MFP subunit